MYTGHDVILYIVGRTVWSNEEQGSGEGTCWLKDVLDLNGEWANIRTTGQKQHHHHHHQQQHQGLPELEPLRLEMRPPYGIHQSNHQVTVRMSLPYGGTARLPCPVRQLGNKTVSWSRAFHLWFILFRLYRPPQVYSQIGDVHWNFLLLGHDNKHNDRNIFCFQGKKYERQIVSILCPDEIVNQRASSVQQKVCKQQKKIQTLTTTSSMPSQVSPGKV